MTVRQLLSRWQLTGERYDKVKLDPDEWWLGDLARELSVSYTTLRRWIALGWVHYRRTPQLDYHLIWANTGELDRLCRLRGHGRKYPRIPTPAALTTPKRRPPDTDPSKNSKAKSSRSHQRKCHNVAS